MAEIGSRLDQPDLTHSFTIVIVIANLIALLPSTIRRVRWERWHPSPSATCRQKCIAPCASGPGDMVAEIREILEQADKPEGRLKVGSMLTSIAREAGGLTDAEAEQFDRLRDRSPAEPMRFECHRDDAASPEPPIHRRLTP